MSPLPVVLRVEAPSKAAEFRLSKGSCVIGSGSQCDLVIDDPTVSRKHAELHLVPEGVLVADLGSRNGTLFMGNRIEKAVLLPGTRIKLGGATLRIDFDESYLRSGDVTASQIFRGLFGASEGMHRLFTTITRLDGSLVPTLVVGESGTGKELVARALHEGSRVSAGPFVAVNCGAVSPELVTSTLFGHRRGAFTGAVDARKGAFAAADGGTLFLDELGELPLEAQPALLRALETGEIQAVGEDTSRKVNVRVITATHRNLSDLVREGRFREDLYYRLAVVTLQLLPLRERKEDIRELAKLFARQEGLPELDDEIIAELERRDYPGNVRELRNAVLAYVALGDLNAPVRSTRSPEALGTEPTFEVPYLAQRDAVVEGFTRKYLVAVLKETQGNQSEAARLAGLDRTYFGRLLVKYGLGKTNK